MNCTDCRDHFAASAEHLLEGEAAREYQHHLVLCADCRKHVTATEALCQQLQRRGESVATVSVATHVMRRIPVSNTSIAAGAPNTRLMRWWLGLGAAIAASFAVLGIGVMLSPRDTKAQAAVVMARGINATPALTTVHLRGRMRTPPADNFSRIDAQAGFCAIELWKEFGGEKRWRIEKPGRIGWMDGQATMLYVRPSNSALKVSGGTRGAFDTGWLHSVTDIEQALTNGLAMARNHGWKMELTKETDSAGVAHQLVAIDVPAAAPANDYLHNQFLDTAATRRLYRFNDQSGQLEALQIYLQEKTDYALVFEVTQIDYNQPFTASVFAVDLPAGVTWSEFDRPQAQPVAPLDPRYAALTPEQAARAFFEACGRQDWSEAEKFWPRTLNDRIKTGLGGLTVVRVGESFTSAISTAQFVPYEIRLSNGATKTHNLALKKDPRTGGWRVDGGI